MGEGTEQREVDCEGKKDQSKPAGKANTLIPLGLAQPFSWPFSQQLVHIKLVQKTSGKPKQHPSKAPKTLGAIKGKEEELQQESEREKADSDGQ